jgi:AP-4 complex subunit sigma-1
MIKFFLMVNKQGQTRLAQYYEYLSIKDRNALEGEIIRKCLSRSQNQVFAHFLFSRVPFVFHLSPFYLYQCSFVEYRNYTVVYRRYASLFFIVGTDNSGEENELGVLEFIHNLVETMDKYFENVVRVQLSIY